MFILSGAFLLVKSLLVNVVKNYSYLVGVDEFFENVFMILLMFSVSNYVNKEELLLSIFE